LVVKLIFVDQTANTLPPDAEEMEMAKDLIFRVDAKSKKDMKLVKHWATNHLFLKNLRVEFCQLLIRCWIHKNLSGL